jgi:ethanolamine utilization microcompartment shell protein EutL
VGGASALGLGDALGASLSGISAIDAASKQATVQVMGLASLSASIDQIVALFSGLNQKTLKAASDSAEMVGKIASAGGSCWTPSQK